MGADGRTDGEEVHGAVFHFQISFSDLEHLTRVTIGWDIEDRYIEQVRFSGLHIKCESPPPQFNFKKAIRLRTFCHSSVVSDCPLCG